jgi:hypothetical protein
MQVRYVLAHPVSSKGLRTQGQMEVLLLYKSAISTWMRLKQARSPDMAGIGFEVE